MQLGAGKAMMTLDLRESKSSLAGVMMAAAMEGVGVMQFVEHVAPHLDDIPEAIEDVLSRVNLPAIGASPAHSPAPAVPGGGAGANGAAVEGVDPSPTKDLPSPVDLADQTSAPKASVDVGDPQAAAAPPAGHVQPSGRSGAAAADLTDTPGAGKRHPVDPSQFGQDGHGGALSPEGAELLENKNVTLDASAVADIKHGRIDPRVIAAAAKISERHRIVVTCTCSDHPRLTTGGSVSNHAYGRGLDIGSVDGEIVHPGSAAARELASELSQLPQRYRPDEIGSPWPISDPGYFTDAAHKDHLHLGFKTEIDPSWTPPADVAAKGADAGAGAAPVAPAVALGPAAAPAGAAAAPPATPAAAAPPKAGDSGGFMAVARAAAERKDRSGTFMAAQPPVGPPSAVADPATVPGMVDAAAAAAPGSGASSVGAAALKVAQTQLGVHESGVNSGAEVDKYLAAAKVGPGNPWCASFVTWSLGRAGHKMSGSGWAAVQTWVRHAEAKQDDLQIVSADQARPGDIVAYDWGHGEDFGSDGHIGFLASDVKGGKFTALEGNNHDAVMKVPRDANMANVKFIRVGGTEPPSGPAADAATPRGGGAADVAAAAAGAGGANPYPGDSAPKAEIAAWMGREAEKRGLPKQLPVMASLVESGVKNLHYGDADSVGFFQMRVGTWNRGAYKGFPEKPELQVKWFLDQAEAVKKQRIARGQSVTDASQFGNWIADIERPAEQYRGRYALRLGEANGLLGQARSAPAAAAASAAATPGSTGAATAPAPEPGNSGQFMAPQAHAASAAGKSGQFMAAQPPAGPASAIAPPAGVPGMVDATAAAAPGSGSSPFGAAALKVAQTQLGVHERGVNSGAEVDKYLAAAGVGPGNPWCASFVTWSLGRAGHKMPGSGWAAVQTWVRHAEAKENDLQIVSADQARPGDIVAYDWGHGEDFGSDGHIGFLASDVKGGKFTALEGNNHDAVMKVPRDVNMANVKFIRIGGDAPPGAAAAPSGAAADAVASAAGGGRAGAHALAALKEAEKYKGTAYRWGGSTPQTGFDCSGLVQWAYAKAGIQLPRVTDAQFTAGNGSPVDRSHLRPGDLVFFGRPGNIYHVGISMGGDKFLHAPKTGDVVKVASLSESYFAQNFAGGRRFDHGAAVAEAAAPAADGAAPAAAGAAIARRAVAGAQAGVARAAAGVRRHNSGLFMAVRAQEERRHATVQFMKAIDPKAAGAAAA